MMPRSPKRLTSQLQVEVENDIGHILRREAELPTPFHLHTVFHRAKVKATLSAIPIPFGVIQASKPWFVYWAVNSLAILSDPVLDDPQFATAATAQLKKSACVKTGGYSGLSLFSCHLLNTYAAVHALVTIGTPEALESIDRAALYRFILSLKMPDGGFRVNSEGEYDMRATYSAVCVARTLGFLTDELVDGVSDWVLSCQTYEGGFGGEPGDEAHGGYSYCAIATLSIIGIPDDFDLVKFLGWLLKKQTEIEGGFRGRCNKLVDSCYTFWMGASIALCIEHLSLNAERRLRIMPMVVKVFEYAIGCCQSPNGGFIDRPSDNCIKHVDLYHTCYSLSGMSALQEFLPENAKKRFPKLAPIDLIANASREKVKNAMEFFEGKKEFER